MKKSITGRAAALILSLLLIAACLAPAAHAIVLTDVKNVILLIGDGMGENSLEWTKAERGAELFLDTMPYRGYSRTDSLSGLTDSAAGGTALACGHSVFNSNLGEMSLLIGGRGATLCTYTNLCEAAKSIGKRAGIVTSDVNSGATPASFSVHAYKRGLTEEITGQQLNCGLDLIWAADNGLTSRGEFEAKGWTYSETLSELREVKNGEKSFAAISSSIYYDTGAPEDAPLSVLTEMAIENLDNEKGFFLMVEGAHIDKNSHGNNSEGMMNAVIEFDKSVEKAVEFAKRDGNTIVAVTADHETGGITYNAEKQTFEYTTDGHTDADVPLLLYGADDLVSGGSSVKNTQVAKYLAKRLGYTRALPETHINFRFPVELFDVIFKYFGDLIKGN